MQYKESSRQVPASAPACAARGIRRWAGQPFELAPAYVYLASRDFSYVTGQVIHVNGGTMVES